MELGVGDRIVLLSILPSAGDLLTVRIVHDLKQALSFSEEEHESLQIKVEGDKITWGGDDEVKEIPIGPRAHVLVGDTLKELDKEKAITEDHLGLWEKFIDEREETPEGKTG